MSALVKLDTILLVKVNGTFYTKPCEPVHLVICPLRQRVDELDPRGQFHQHFTHSFYVVRRSQKHKKIQSSSPSFFVLLGSAQVKAESKS